MFWFYWFYIPKKGKEMTLEEQTRELAYLNWEQAGYPQGDGVNFWLEAEQAVLSDVVRKEIKRHSLRSPDGRFAPYKVAAKISPQK